MKASTGKRILLIVSGALAAGMCGFALYHLLSVVRTFGHPKWLTVGLLGVGLLGGLCLGLASVLAGIKGSIEQ